MNSSLRASRILFDAVFFQACLLKVSFPWSFWNWTEPEAMCCMQFLNVEITIPKKTCCLLEHYAQSFGVVQDKNWRVSRIFWRFASWTKSDVLCDRFQACSLIRDFIKYLCCSWIREVPCMAEGWLHFCRDTEEGQQDAGAVPESMTLAGRHLQCHFFHSLQVKIIICNTFWYLSVYFSFLWG